MAALPPTEGVSPPETGREALQVDDDGFASSVEEQEVEEQDRAQAAVQGPESNVQFQVVSEDGGGRG